MRDRITIENDIKVVEDRRSALFLQKAPIDEELTALYKKCDKLKDELSKVDLNSGMSEDELIIYHLFEDGSVNGVRYDARRKFWQKMGFNQSGYYPEIQQCVLKISINRDKKESYEQTLAAVKKVLPFIKVNKEGYKLLGIFEHTLSEYGTFELGVNPEGKFEIVTHVYHRQGVEATFDDLEACLLYIQRSHYYDTIDN